MHQKNPKFKKIMTIMALAIGAVILSLAPEAYAAKLKISDGITDIFIEDESADDDLVGVIGAISATEVLIGGFLASVSTGSTKPASGSDVLPELHLTQTLIGGPGELWVEFTEVDFISSSGLTGFLASIGGSSGGSVEYSYETYLDDTNAEFGKGTLLTSTGPLSDGGGSLPGIDIMTAITSSNPDGDPYSLTLVAHIKHNDSFNSSIDADLVHTPEPSTFLMLGMGLIGLVGYRKRKATKAA